MLRAELQMQQICKVVGKRIQEVCATQINNPNSIPNNSEAIESLKQLEEKCDLFFTALGKIWHTPPRDEGDEDCARQGPIFNVRNQDGVVELINEEYLRASGIDTAEDLIQLSKTRTLDTTIYSPDTLERITNANPAKGYDDRVFQMVHTGMKIKWNTHTDEQTGESVRIGEDVTNASEKMFKLVASFSRGTHEHIPFGLQKLLNDYRQKAQDILPTLKTNASFHSNIDMLEHIARIGDMIVDRGSFLVTLVNGRTFDVLNEAYVATSGYSREELAEML